MRFPRPDRITLPLLTLVIVAASVATADVYVELEDGVFEPSVVRLAADTGDPMFAFLMGVLDEVQFGEVDTAFLDSMTAAEGGSKIPIHLIETMDRWPVQGEAESRVRLNLTEAVDEPIPYSILGYRPGRFRTSRVLWMTHWRFPERRFLVPGEDGEDEELVVRNAHLFVIDIGHMEMDVDGWLDRMLGSRLDDVNISSFFVFHDGDERVSLGMGYSTKGKGRTGAFSFSENKTMFPAPKKYLAIGRMMRAEGERRMEAVGRPPVRR